MGSQRPCWAVAMEFIPLPHVTPATAVVLRQTVDGRSAVAALEGEGGYWLPDTVSCGSEGDRSCPQQLSPGLGPWCHRLEADECLCLAALTIVTHSGGGAWGQSC